jgi:hypothetical protein
MTLLLHTLSRGPGGLDWAFLAGRALVGVAATYMGANLAIAFILNHFMHKPKRWLVGWQSIAWLGVGLDGFVRVWARSIFIYTGIAIDVTSWPYLITMVLTAIGATGTLLTWLKWPNARTVGLGEPKSGEST